MTGEENGVEGYLQGLGEESWERWDARHVKMEVMKMEMMKIEVSRVATGELQFASDFGDAAVTTAREIPLYRF